MGLIQSAAAYVVSQQSDADEIKGRNKMKPDAGPSGVIRPLAPGLREPVQKVPAGLGGFLQISEGGRNEQLVLCVSRPLMD